VRGSTERKEHFRPRKGLAAVEPEGGQAQGGRNEVGGNGRMSPYAQRDPVLTSRSGSLRRPAPSSDLLSYPSLQQAPGVLRSPLGTLNINHARSWFAAFRVGHGRSPASVSPKSRRLTEARRRSTIDKNGFHRFGPTAPRHEKSMTQASVGRHRVVIVGSGFGGFFAAKSLTRAPTRSRSH
jgi:hypothetical protein